MERLGSSEDRGAARCGAVLNFLLNYISDAVWTAAHGAGSDERTTLEPTPSPFQCQKPHKLPDAPSSAQPRPARAARPGVAPPGHASRRRRRPGHGQPATEGGRRRGRRGAEGGGWRAGGGPTGKGTGKVRERSGKGPGKAPPAGGPARCVLEGHRTRPRQAAKGRAPHPPQDCALLGRLITRDSPRLPEICRSGRSRRSSTASSLS